MRTDFHATRRTGPGRWFPYCFTLLMAILVAGCGSRPRVVTGPDIPGYQRMIEDVKQVDTSSLRGRLIMLDPGHGGRFRGALGPNGLAEADVNLGVALYLRGLLEWAGADVVMTRTTDRDFLAGTDSTLAADLAFRVSMMDSIQPDVFISLHHNSNPLRDPTINETQTYYRLGDEGASQELARSIHRHLALNLQITPARILPGNFHVLRNATVPAVLGEPAMLSNPVMAGRLTLAASQRLEAEAYFLGLLDYFAQGAPAWKTTAPDTIVLPAEGKLPTISWTFMPDHGRGADFRPASGIPGPDPDSFQVLFGERPQPFALSPDGRTVTWSPPSHLAQGAVAISGRNLAGRSTPADTVRITPAGGLPPRVTIIKSSGDRNEVLIGWSMPPGSHPVPGTISWTAGPIIETGGRSRGGRLVASGDTTWCGKTPLWKTPDLPAGTPCPVKTQTLPATWHWRGITGLPGEQGNTPAQPLWRYRLGTVPPGLDPRLVPRGFVAVPDSGAWLESDGLLPLLAVGDPDSSTGTDPWTVELLEPALWGRTIVIDPRGGGTVTDGQGPLGTRGADLNLQVARFTAAYLAGEGANVLLTRTGDRAPEAPDKVLQAREAHADLFLVIGRHSSADQPPIRHYPGSGHGNAWAGTTAGMLARAGVTVDQLIIGPGSDYLLRHTHCPALVVELPAPRLQTDEMRESSLANQRGEASALALGVMAYLAGDGSDYPAVTLEEMLEAVPGAPETGKITGALWDGNIVPVARREATDPAGDRDTSSLISYRMLLPARGANHQLEIHTADSWRVWVLRHDSQGWRGRMVLTGFEEQPD